MASAGSPSEDSRAAPGCGYDRHYFETALGAVPYDRRYREWTDFFATIADRIVAQIKPRRVLDVGCAKGFLVEALRDRGVEAFGIDISEYAIGEVREDIRPYCRLASAAEPLHGRYDLITCIEVVEHLGEEEGRRAIANICGSTEDVLFSSTPDDFAEPTHVNVRPTAWWIERFAEHGFHVELEFDAGVVAPHALRFRAGPATRGAVDGLLGQRHRLMDQIVALRSEVASRNGSIEELRREAAERKETMAALGARRDRLQSDLAAVQRGAQALRNELAARRAEQARLAQDVAAASGILAELRGTHEGWHRQIAALHLTDEEKNRLIAGLNHHLLVVQRTIGWKILERLRRGRDRLAPPNSRRRDAYWFARRCAEVLLDEGVKAFCVKARQKVRRRWRGGERLIKVRVPEQAPPDPTLQYQLWIARHRLAAHDIAVMKAEIENFAYSPVISVVVPVYNTDEIWLRKAIESVGAQIYPHWQLCLVNDASTRPHVPGVLDEYGAGDPRVEVAHLPSNRGISGASAHGLEMATGEFVALLDHDDELAPEALFEVVKRLNQEGDLDLIYTDEDKLELDGHRVEPFFKPDWSPDLLLSMNYITHLSLFRRSLLAEIGGFRPGLDGSQDYDLLLRASEHARRIAHIPKILYHWRKIPGSAAASSAAKPFAYEAARQAIADAVKRRGREADVNCGLPGLYTVRYKLRGVPLVSIIVPALDHWPRLRQCLHSIESRTRYPRYEIIVLDSGSADAETMAGLDAVARRWPVHRHPGALNSSALNNLGASRSRGEYLVFLGADTQVIEPDWLGAMLEHAQRPEVGAVGARLHRPDGRIQHAGLVLGVGGVVDHAFCDLPADAFGYFALAGVVRNVSAVSGACMMIGRGPFEALEGFDERFRVALNDVDLCLRLGRRGHLIVYTPHALLIHQESGNGGRPYSPADEELMWTVWGDAIRKGDPYYNPNLALSRADWGLPA